MSRRAMMVAPGGGGGGGPARSTTIPVTSGLWQYLARAENQYTDAGTTLATANDDPVYRWGDASGNSRHADQATANRRPFLRTTGTSNGSADNSLFFRINTLPFGDDHRRLGLPDMSALTEAEVFIVIKTVACPNANADRTGIWSTAADFSTHFPYTDTHLYEGWGSTARR